MTNIVDMKIKLEKLGLNSKTFCFAPYINIDLDQTGETYICCASKQSIGNWKTQKLSNNYNNEIVKNLRKDLFNGIKNSNCKSCWFVENKNSKSTRLDSFNDAIEHIDNLEFFVDQIKKDYEFSSIDNVKRIEIRLSSLCNLRCAHCSPKYSTQWVNILTKKDNFDFFSKYDEFEKNLTNKNIKQYYKTSLISNSKYEFDIKNTISKIPLIQFAGGEPLLSPEHFSWLEYLVYDAKTSSDQILEYNTNLMIKDIDRFFPLWKKFKNVTLRSSIDTDFDSIEYFRANSNKDLLIENLKKINQEFTQNFDNIGSVTFNMLSALRYKKIMQDWIDNNLNFHCSIVHNHPFSSLELPLELNKQVINEMEWCKLNVQNYTDNKKFIKRFIKYTDYCLNFIKNYEPKKYFSTSTINYILFFDRISKKNIVNYFPELEFYIHAKRNRK